MQENSISLAELCGSWLICRIMPLMPAGILSARNIYEKIFVYMSYV